MPAPNRTGKQFVCDQCTSTFTRNEFLQRHIRGKHLGVRDHKCETCPAAFTRSDLLKRHLKSCPGATGSDRPAKKQRLSKAPETVPFSLPSEPSTSASSISPGSGSGVSPSTAHTSPPPIISPNFGDELPLKDSVESIFGSLDRPAAPPSTSQPPSVTHPLPSSSAQPLDRFTDEELLASSVLEDLFRSPKPLSWPLPESTATNGGRAWHGAPERFGNVENIAVGLVGSSSAGDSSEGASQVIATLAHQSAQGAWMWKGYDSMATLMNPGELDTNQRFFNLDDPAVYGGSEESASSLASDSFSLDIFGAAASSSSANLSLPNGSSDRIEDSAEARALADYFSKGGVGIPALDPSFFHQPSTLPAHWIDYNPGAMNRADSRFFLPTQKFCLGGRFPWHVPPLPTLSRYAMKATEAFLPLVPIIHGPSINLAEMPTSTAFALTVAGARYSLEGQLFSDEMLAEKRVFLIRYFNKPNLSAEEKFSTLQALLFYQLLGMGHVDEKQRSMSFAFHGALVMMYRQMDLISDVRADSAKMQAEMAGVPLPLHLLVPPTDPEMHCSDHAQLSKYWKAWVEQETRRRVAFIIYLSDVETSTKHANPSSGPTSGAGAGPLLPFSELDVDLPAPDELWHAKDHFEWRDTLASLLGLRQAGRSSGTIAYPPLHFVDTVKALLAAPGPHGAFPLLPQISMQRGFPLLILSKTMSFLHLKAKEALAQLDPFATLLGPLNVLHDRRTENLNLIKRIEAAEELLAAASEAEQAEKKGQPGSGNEDWRKHSIVPPAELASTYGVQKPTNAVDDIFGELLVDRDFASERTQGDTTTFDLLKEVDKYTTELGKDFPHLFNFN